MVSALVWGPRRRKRTKGRRSAPWYVNVRYADGTREHKTFSIHDDEKLNEEEAHAYAAKMRAQLRIAGSISRTARSITVADCAERWLKNKKRLKAGTRMSYSSSLRTHIVPGLGEMRVRDVSRQHVSEFLSGLLERGMAEGTLSIQYSVLRQVFERAIFDGVIIENPTDGVWEWLPIQDAKRHGAKLGRKDVLALSFEEHDAFVCAVAAAPDMPRQLRAFWLTMAYSGMRPGECVGLQFADVDLAGRVIHIRRNVAPEHYEAADRIGSTKTNTERNFEMGEDLAAVLAAYLQELELEPSDWLFSTDCAPIARGAIRHSFDALAEAAQLDPKFSAKSLRHSYASRMLMRGANFLWVAKQIGDRPETMLRHYAWALPDVKNNWARLLDKDVSVLREGA